MNPYRKTAITVGVLYIIGTLTGILSVIVTGPILNVPGYLLQLSTHQNQFILGELLVLTMGLALAFVPVMMFPILRKQDEALAVGYVVFRGALETITDIALVIAWFFLLTIGQEFVKAGAPTSSWFQTLGASITGANSLISQIMTIVFIIGAVMFYYLLYRSKLVPRWISAWGLVGAIPYLAAGLLILFGLSSDKETIDTVLRLPIALQEMVLAVWLIAKGFNPSALASLSSRKVD
jgi:hypothetical protein